MNMKKFFLLLGAVAWMSSCTPIHSTYIGKSYPLATEPEIYFSWDDVPHAYETMGHIEATPNYYKTFEDAQTLIEQRAREKGADAVVFTGINRGEWNPTVNTTKQITPNTNGGQTQTITSTGSSAGPRRLTAVFIKYKK